MPAKRKREEDAAPAATPTRSTRSSARAAAKANEETAATETKAKKAKTTTTPKPAKPKATPSKKKAEAQATADESTSKANGKVSTTDEPPKSKSKPAAKATKKTTKATPAADQPKPTPTTPAAAAVKSKPKIPTDVYSDKAALDLFNTYADEDDVDVIGPSGFETMFSDAELSLEGSHQLIISWLFKPEKGTSEMLKIGKEDWLAACKSLQLSSLPLLRLAITDLESLLVMGKPAPKPNPKAVSYNMNIYHTYANKTKPGLQKLYLFCFTLAKPEASKNIEMDTALAMWTVLLTPRFPLMSEVIEYITETGGYKAANKDLWSMMFDFVNSVKPDLTGYEADGAWPSLIDDFVEWKRQKQPTEGEAIEIDD